MNEWRYVLLQLHNHNYEQPHSIHDEVIYLTSTLMSVSNAIQVINKNCNASCVKIFSFPAIKEPQLNWIVCDHFRHSSRLIILYSGSRHKRMTCSVFVPYISFILQGLIVCLPMFAHLFVCLLLVESPLLGRRSPPQSNDHHRTVKRSSPDAFIWVSPTSLYVHGVIVGLSDIFAVFLLLYCCYLTILYTHSEFAISL